VQPLVFYTLGGILFVLGLAAVGGALFGRKPRRRLVLVVLAILMLGAIPFLSACTAPAPTIVATPLAATLSPTTPPADGATPTVPLTPTLALGATVTATVPSIPGQIVFHSGRSGNLDIYTMNADGTDVRRLTDSPARDFEPDWSPDGQSIVFSSDRDDPENSQLYVMDADGGNQRALMPFIAADFVSPRWSPDGEWILMHSNQMIDGQPWFEVYRVRADGTELANLSSTPGNNFRADWSPDGTRIVFVSERDGNRELYVMNADGSNQVRLTNSQADDNRPRWSPDGKTILFESNRDGDNMTLYTMDAPATIVTAPQEDKVRLLTFPGFNSQAGAWAVDGTKIVFSADRDSQTNQNWDVFIMDANGANLYRLTTDPELDRFPAWTP
jgi:TolB protein